MAARDSLSGLGELLSLSEPELRRLVEAAPALYRVFPLRGAAGKKRWIEAPHPQLKRIQRRVLRRLLYRLQPHPAAHGFVPGRSIVSNARPHVGRRWVLTLDLKDFFPTTREEAVREALRPLRGLRAAEREAVLRLVLRRGALPQGAPTSPHLANLAFRPLDQELERLARSNDLDYTRYADDLTFSGEALPRGLVSEAARLLRGRGYRLAPHKTRRMGRHVRQRVTGLVINEGVRLPRELRRWLRAVQHDVELHGREAALQRCGDASSARLAGYLALLRMIEPQRARSELAILREAVLGV
jgi:retron-type reverse transcriptase